MDAAHSLRQIGTWRASMSFRSIVRKLGGMVCLLATAGSVMAGEGVGVHFVDVTTAAGLNYTHGYRWDGGMQDLDLYTLVAGGVAAGDYDGDGWIDLYAVGGDAGRNHLLRNRGDGTFSDEAQAAGVAMEQSRGCGPTFADYDGDGHLDLFLGAIERRGPVLFRNQGDGTFRDVTLAAGLRFELGPYISAAFGDYDRDGDLDLVVTQWGTTLEDFNLPDRQRQLEHLWRNNGDGTFHGYTLGSGLTVRLSELVGLHWYWTFTPNFADINNDGWPDLLLASDFKTSQTFVNHHGRFVETTTDVISDENGMGAAVGDYDNDGDLDWFVSSIFDPDGGTPDWGGSGNRLYRNTGDGTFEDVTEMAGVRDGAWGWGSCFADFNNDGFLDLFHVDGWGFEVGRAKFYDKPSRLFLSNGDGTFSNHAVAAQLDDRGEGRGVVCFDYDHDGDIDLMVANNGQPPRLYRNDGGAHHYLQVKLRGASPNTEAIGARVYVTAGGQTQMRELRAGSNYVSQDPAIAHFGLGSVARVERLRVVWPDQTQIERTDIPGNRLLTLEQEVLVIPTPTSTASATLPPTPTILVSPTPTFRLAGDANCDGVVSAADTTQLVVLLAEGLAGTCGGADVNADQSVDDADLDALPGRLFVAD